MYVFIHDLENYECALTDLVALKAVFLVSSALQTVFWLDALPVRAGILVVVNLAMLWRILWSIGVERRHSWHLSSKVELPSSR
jgi:hypothetical protein